MVKSPELAKLRDVHLPPPLDWWPLAPGWYVVATFVLISVIILSIVVRRHYVHGRSKRQALRLLTLYQQQDANSQISCARISELLKRVALMYYPRKQVAGLQGEAWLTFLNNTAKGVDFNAVKTQLLERPFQPPQSDNLQPLFKCAGMWIKKQGKRRIQKPCSN